MKGAARQRRSVFVLSGMNFVNDSFGAVLALGLGINWLVASL